MWFRFFFLVFFFFVFVDCENEDNNSRRHFGNKNYENLRSNKSSLHDDREFSNSRGVINSKGSEHLTQYTSNIGEGERTVGSVPESSFKRKTEESHGRENNFDRSQLASPYQSNSDKKNNRKIGIGEQLFGSRPLTESSQLSDNKGSDRHPNVQSNFRQSYERSESGQQFQSKPNNQGFSSGRPAQESANENQQTGLRPTQNENNFSGRPVKEASFGSSSEFKPSNKRKPGTPSGGSTFGQFSAFRPGNEGHTERPNEVHPSGRPSEDHFGRPNEALGVGHSTGLLHEAQTGSGTQRPNANKEVTHVENKPEGERNEGSENGKEDEKDVCFTHIGCFKMGKPWKSTLRPVGAPHAPEKIQTVVHFYSRQNPKQPENIIVYPQVIMGRAHFNPQKISAVIVHGFSNSGNATWMREMKDVYLRKVDANVMIVDWGKGAQLLNYLQVAGNTRVVGKQLGTFIKYLIEQYGADPGKFHLIGHSLGAQICSYAAKDVPGIARLTALDPAQPGFEGFSKEVRLDQTDAEFVDVIHTDARPFIPTLGFGMIAPHGHVDFYMNGGFDQPGCIPPAKKDLPVIKSFLDFAKFPVETIAKTIACPHARAYEYLIEAFNETDNCIFWGHKTDVKNVFKTVTNTVTQGVFKKFTALSTTCSKDDCIPLGFATKKSPLRGAFVVTTSGRPPYCISEPGVPPETLPQDRKKKSMIEKIKATSILG